MAYTPASSIIGLQAIATVSSTAQIATGTVIRAIDSTLGGGEFIYLPTIASVVVGSLVNYRMSASGVYTTAMNPNTANQASPVAVAMCAGVASTYGWFQIEGNAVIKKTAVKVSPNVALFQSATTGRVTSAVATGKQILGIRSGNTATVASATSTINVTINRPHNQGQII